ncbi:MAG: hypothetical protein AAF787_00080 [Chloroflexota bacterium]
MKSDTRRALLTMHANGGRLLASKFPGNTLSRLACDGYVVPARNNSKSVSCRVYYMLTGKGRRAIEQMLEVQS